MTRIKELPACAQKVVIGAMSRAVIENLYGTAPYASDDLPFSANVYNQWKGSDELLKELPDGPFDPTGPIGMTLFKIYDSHGNNLSLFDKAEKALAPVLEEQERNAQSSGL